MQSRMIRERKNTGCGKGVFGCKWFVRCLNTSSTVAGCDDGEEGRIIMVILVKRGKSRDGYSSCALSEQESKTVPRTSAFPFASRGMRYPKPSGCIGCAAGGNMRLTRDETDMNLYKREDPSDLRARESEMKGRRVVRAS